MATPVLSVRGELEPIDLERYIDGFKQAGLEHIESAIVPNAGHFVPIEQPLELAALLRQYCLKITPLRRRRISQGA